MQKTTQLQSGKKKKKIDSIQTYRSATGTPSLMKLGIFQSPPIERSLKRRYKRQVSASQTDLKLKKMLQKNGTPKERSLVNYVIPYLQRKYNHSRFSLHNLHSLYLVLLKESKNSVKKFKKNL